jgi:putative ABC transport system permease protein
MTTIVQDLRFASRSFLKSPRFTAVAISVVALAIGINSVVFTLTNALLLRPLPLPQSDRLVAWVESENGRPIGTAFANYLDIRDRNTVLQDVALVGESHVSLSGSDTPEELIAGMTAGNAFDVLGVHPWLGHGFSAEDDAPHADPTVVLGYDIWQSRFGSDLQIVGKKIKIDGAWHSVLGVMPRGFKFPEQAQLWVPFQLDPAKTPRTDHFLNGIARLKPGISVEQARSELNVLLKQILKENPRADEGQSLSVVSLHQDVSSGYRTQVLTLLAAVGFVLLIACANIANLLMVRGAGRKREMAIRAAIGATRARLLRQLTVESLLLAVIGGIVGLLAASWSLRYLPNLIPVQIPYWVDFHLDFRVITYMIALVLFTGVIAGIIPAIHASRTDLSDALKESGRSSGGIRSGRVRDVLVMGEVALSLVLLVGGGLLVRTLVALTRVDPGFNPQKLLTFRFILPAAEYGENNWGIRNARVLSFQRELRRQLAAVPGVVSVAETSTLPLLDGWGRSVSVEGGPTLSIKDAPITQHALISPGYFQTMQIPLLRGRDFTDTDNGENHLAIVDQGLAEHYWPGQDGLGKRIRLGPPEDQEPWHTIIGVVGKVRNRDLAQAGEWNVYLPQSEISRDSTNVIIRTTQDPLSFVQAAQNRLASLDREIPLGRVKTFEQIVNESIWEQRFIAILLAIFAALALLLAAIGLYGVISYSVGQRLHEMGIRLALGARPADLLNLILREGIWLALIGVVAGLVLSFAVNRLIASLLFGVGSSDVVTLGGSALVLLIISGFAVYIPARAATRVDPIVTLRCE